MTFNDDGLPEKFPKLFSLIKTKKEFIALTSGMIVGTMYGDVYKAFNTAKQLADVLEKEGCAPWN